MPASIKNTLANSLQYLSLDVRLNTGRCLATALLCTVSSVAFTMLFRQKGLIAAGCLTLAAFARRIRHVAAHHQSTIPPFFQSKLPLTATPTLIEIVLHRPEKLYTFLSGLQKTMRLESELARVQTEWNLTALHVAVLAGNVGAIELLVNRGASLTTQDKMGCTPIHLAVLTDNASLLRRIEEIAQKRGVAYENIQDRYGATVAQLKVISRDPKISPEKVVSRMRTSSGVIAPITAQEYKALTGTQYCDYVRMPPGELLKQWTTKVNEAILDDAGEKSAVNQLLGSNCKGILVKNDKTGLGVWAAVDLEVGEMAFRYGGEKLDPKCSTNSEYCLDQIESKENSNLASRVNDGFPRLYFEKINGLGSSIEIAMIVCYKTASNTELTIDYGPSHFCKYGRYTLVDEEILKTFAWRDTLTRVQQLNAQEERAILFSDRVQESRLIAPIRYLISTPKALAYMLTHAIFSLNNLKDLHALVKPENKDEGTEHDKLLDEYREKLIAIYTKLEEINDPKFTLAINGFINTIFEKHHVIVGMYQIRVLTESLSDDHALYDSNPPAWNAKMDRQEALLQLMDGLLDSARDSADAAEIAYKGYIAKLKAADISNAMLMSLIFYPMGHDQLNRISSYLEKTIRL